MKRIAIAGFQHETNTFSPIPTTYEDYTLPNAGRILLPDDLRELGSARFNSPLSGFYDQAAALEFELIPLISFSTEPSNMTPMAVFERLMEQLLERLDTVECDGIFLDLHGAMALEGHVDGETEILKRICERNRSRVRMPIVASLDLHGNLHPRSVELCTGFVACREYPHIDMFETGQRCAHLMAYALSEKPLFKALRHIPFLMPTSKETTFREPSKSLYALIGQAESRPGVISVSILQGFSGSDVEYTGPCVLAYADTQETADRTVDFLYDSILARENEFDSQVPGAAEAVAGAIRLAQTAGKPVILADIQDNAGGGSSSDTMFVI
ncbi:MAG: M81 family metallopeptidase, partial [Anaerolineaceae bacterium]